MKRTAFVVAVITLCVACADNPPTAPREDARPPVSLNAVGDPIDSYDSAFPRLGFEGMAFGDAEANGDIAIDTITGELRVRNWQTGQQVFMYLPVSDFVVAHDAFSNLQLGDLNAQALQNLNPLENMPPGYNPERAGGDAIVSLGSSAPMTGGAFGVILRPWEPWMTTRDPSTAHTSPALPGTANIFGHATSMTEWSPRCTEAATIISGLKESYLRGRRSYIAGLVGSVNWVEALSSEVGGDGKVRIGLNTDPYNMLVHALNYAENRNASIVYDLTRVWYNSWGCEGTLRALVPQNLIWNSDYAGRNTLRSGSPAPAPGSGSGGGVASGMVWRQECVTVYITWAVSYDGGATWIPKQYPVRQCDDVRVQ